MAKRNRKRSTGWAKTKKYLHERHPANYVRKVGDKIEYITFTHSPEVHLSNGAVVQTVPMSDNVSKSEREKAKREGKTRFETRSYAYPPLYLRVNVPLYIMKSWASLSLRNLTKPALRQCLKYCPVLM